MILIDTSILELIKQLPNLAIALIALAWLARVAGQMVDSQSQTVKDLIVHQKALIDRLLLMVDREQALKEQIADATLFKIESPTRNTGGD
jgi:hypothetical protein